MKPIEVVWSPEKQGWELSCEVEGFRIVRYVQEGQALGPMIERMWMLRQTVAATAARDKEVKPTPTTPHVRAWECENGDDCACAKSATRGLERGAMAASCEHSTELRLSDGTTIVKKG